MAQQWSDMWLSGSDYLLSMLSPPVPPLGSTVWLTRYLTRKWPEILNFLCKLAKVSLIDINKLWNLAGTG